jgi:hypothetical protein
MDLKERLENLTALNEVELPKAEINPAFLTEDEIKVRYLSLLAEGHMQPEAARRCGKTGKQMRAYRSEKSPRYDREFSERYEEIMAPGGEFEESISQIAEHALIDAAKSGNVRAIEKVLMAYHAKYEFLRPTAFTGDTYNVDKLVQIMPGIPTPLLEQMREELLRQKELPAVIDQ